MVRFISSKNQNFTFPVVGYAAPRAADSLVFRLVHPFFNIINIDASLPACQAQQNSLCAALQGAATWRS